MSLDIDVTWDLFPALFGVVEINKLNIYKHLLRDAPTETTVIIVMADAPWQDRDPNNEDEDDDVDENVKDTVRGDGTDQL